MTRLRMFETKAPAAAIAAYVLRRGAAYSGEILDEFDISPSTLRRRRQELRWLGIEFIDRGRGSLYAPAEVAKQLPTTSRPYDAYQGATPFT